MIKRAVGERGLYVHIPFCPAKCHYCDFYSLPLPGGDELERYTRGLAAEIEQRASFYDRQPIETVYFGGGTPSLLSPAQIEKVLRLLHDRFPISARAEITMEANPLTVSRVSLHDCRRAGINRLSLGVQSFRDRELQVLGRVHKAADSREAIAAARAAGFQNLSLDLIYGLPGQTTEDWNHNLQAALAFAPEHLSLYLLQLEADTPLGRRVEQGELALPDDDQALVLYQFSQQTLADAGYGQYEISNFARPGRECRHNLLYWDSREYIGLGAGAVSFLNRVRRRNTLQLQLYLQGPHYPEGFWQGEVLEEMDERQRWLDALLLGLRTNRGVSLSAFKRRFGVDLEQEYRDIIGSLTAGGFMEIAGGHLRLTVGAYFISNQVLCRFLS